MPLLKYARTSLSGQVLRMEQRGVMWGTSEWPRVLKHGPHCRNVLCATFHVQPSLPTVSSRSLALRSTGVHAGRVGRRFGSRRRDGSAGIPASLGSWWRRRVRFAKRLTRLAEASEAVGVGGAVEPRFGPGTSPFAACPDMSYSGSTARNACSGSAHRIGISTGASVARSAYPLDGAVSDS